MTSSRTQRWMIAGLVLGLLAAWYAITRRADGTLVVYCTHDLVYAEPVLEEFTRRTGIPVTLVGDTEATKSLGLVERLLREGSQTPCDLFWNNEVLGTIRLQRRGLLAAYTGPAADRIPARFQDPHHQWYGFAGRMRVWISRTDVISTGEITAGLALPGLSGFDSPRLGGLPRTDLSRVAMAKPLYGTTFTQFALLWKHRGPEATMIEHRALVERHCRIVAGNAMVRDVVAGGGCDLGMTDTDDVFAALDAGSKVTMEPIRIEGQTLCIPNTVALITHSDRGGEARQLMEYLLSEDVELQLARAARQIPLGEVLPEKIPADVQPLAVWARESWNVAEAGDVADDCLNWLKSEYAR